MSNLPTAVPNAAIPDPAPSLLAGKNAPPPAPVQQISLDPALDSFARIAAERRSRTGQEPVAIPFGAGTIRIHRVMPATFAADLLNVEHDANAAITAIRSAIIDADHAQYEHVLSLPPDNDEGIDGLYLMDFIGVLSEFYSGRKLGNS